MFHNTFINRILI